MANQHSIKHSGKCSVSGCENTYYGKGLCTKHYARLRRINSTSLPDKKILLCGAEGCQTKRYAKGYCRLHYRRIMANGSTYRPVSPTICAVEGCSLKHYAKSYCRKHYLRMSKNGNITPYRIVGDDEARFESHVERIPFSTCHWWVGTMNGHGYGMFSIKGKNIFAHRYSYTQAKGKIPEDMCVCHKCDNPLCVNPDHLWIGTNVDNIKDMNNKGRHGMARLTRNDVISIRSDNRTQQVIANEYGITQAHVSSIKRRNAWANVQ